MAWLFILAVYFMIWAFFQARCLLNLSVLSLAQYFLGPFWKPFRFILALG
jgi:hypothetical protein